MLRITLAASVVVIVFVVATATLNPTPDAIQHARVQNQIERMELMQTVGNVAIVGTTALLLMALTVGLRWLWNWSGRPLTLYARDGLFPAVVIDRSTPLDRLTGQRRILAHDPNRSGGATLSIHAARNGEITAHGAQVESQDQAAIIRAALGVQKTQAGYRRGPTVAEIKGELGYYDRTPRPAMITETKQLPQQTTQPILTLSEAIRQVGGAGDIPLGQQQDGMNALAVWKPSTAPHMSILGSTQQGKTSGAGFTIAACAIRHGWRVVILDPEEEGQWRIFQPWAEWTHADEDSVTPHVLAVHSEYERRGQMMVAAGASSFAELQPVARRILLVIEEYGDLRNRADAAGSLADFDAALAQLARRGGKRGFHLLLIDQHHKGSYDTPPWPETVARNVHRLSFHQPSNDSSLCGWWDMQGLGPGQFAYKAERYQAWHARPEVERILTGVPRLTGQRILDNAGVGGDVRVVRGGSPDPSIGVNSHPNTTNNGTTNIRANTPRDWEVFAQNFFAKNPEASQRGLTRAMAEVDPERRDASAFVGGLSSALFHRYSPKGSNYKPQPPTVPAPSVWDVMGREVIDLSSEAGADAIRRIDWRKVEVR